MRNVIIQVLCIFVYSSTLFHIPQHYFIFVCAHPPPTDMKRITLLFGHQNFLCNYAAQLTLQAITTLIVFVGRKCDELDDMS